MLTIMKTAPRAFSDNMPMLGFLEERSSRLFMQQPWVEHNCLRRMDHTAGLHWRNARRVKDRARASNHAAGVFAEDLVKPVQHHFGVIATNGQGRADF
jgi:hypothetical protein